MITIKQQPIVCKFGGSSVANANQIEKVKNIIAGNKQRRYIVVSAPGRDTDHNEKITDHLINIATDGKHFFEARKNISPEQSKNAVTTKFAQIIGDLGIKADGILKALKKDLDSDLEGEKRVAFVASRGEHYNAHIIAEYLNVSGITSTVKLPEEFGLIVSGRLLDAKIKPETYANLQSITQKDIVVVIPGFYGITEEGDIALFSRGGSDLTGGEIAYAVNASIYENWTDTDGIYEADPRIIPEAAVIPRLTFKEIRLLSSKGFNVFHFDAMLGCKRAKIPIMIRNTNKPSVKGTIILPERVPEEDIVGIAKLDNMAYIYLEKDMLSEELGFTQKLLALFNKYGINTFHYPTDKDDIAVLVEQEDLKGAINNLRSDIEEQLAPDFMEVIYNLSIISPVGLGLKDNAYPIADAIIALRENNIAIQMLDQSPAHLCFHIGVPQAHAQEAIRILYEKLLKRDCISQEQKERL